MGSEFSMNLTQEIDDYSVGASNLGSTKQWAISNATFSETAYQIKMSAELKKRVALCYLVLTQVPKQGLDELEDFVYQVIDFHQEVNHQPLQLQSPTSVQVKYNKPVVREVFSVGDE